MDQTPLRILVVGGVAGGGSTVARARRLNEHASIVMFEKGPYTGYANCGLPYYLAGEIKEREELFLAGEQELKGWLNVDVRTEHEVLSIDRKRKTAEVKDLKTQKTYREPYDYLVLSPGAEPIRPPALLKNTGSDHPRVLSLRSVPDVDKMKALVPGGVKRVTIVGGGFIGLELAEAFVHQGVKTTLVELLDQVMAVMDPEMVEPVHEVLRERGVDLRLGNSVDELLSLDSGGLKVKLRDGDTFDADLVILAIGVRPDSGLAKNAELDLNERGAIRVNDNLLTSDPCIYAIGDAIEVNEPVFGGKGYVPLAGPANRQGRLAANHIMAREKITDVNPETITYRGTLGSGICRFFNMTIAGTGRTQKILEREGKVLHRDFEVVTVHPNDHAGYYPGATMVSVKLCFEKPSGRLLGAQAVGEKGVDKRIDILSMAIQMGSTVFDLEETELCYSPPFGSAKDPVNMAGFQGANMLRGQFAYVTVKELKSKIESLGSKLTILDVRKPEELANIGMIPGAKNIPLHELRARVDELPKEGEVVAYCRVGFRGYIAACILGQIGFPKVSNLIGGFFSWKREAKS